MTTVDTIGPIPVETPGILDRIYSRVVPYEIDGFMDKPL